MAALILALDQGTTGSSALVMEPGGAVRGRADGDVLPRYPQPGWVEQDAEEIAAVSLAVMREALQAARATPSDIAAIGITNQRETTVVWDRRSGAPVYPAIVWQSRQTAELCDRLVARGAEPLVRARTGLVIDAYFSGTKLQWILDREGLRARAERGELAFGTVDTWLLWRLTGGAAHRTEPTNASRTLLFDIHRRQWDDELLALMGVPRAVLPEVAPSASVFGETAEASGLGAGIPIAGIAGDQQAALFGQGCWTSGLAKNTYGTGCFLVMNTGDRAVQSRSGLLTTLACDAAGGPAYALEGSVFVAGAAVQWLRDALGLVARAEETAALASSIAGTGGVYVVPAFAGLGAPYWDMGARGAVLGLTRGSGRAEIVRATLESIAYQTRDVVESMNADSGLPLRALRVDGGAAANDFLMQFQADVLGVPVERPLDLETTGRGAALLAGIGSGRWRSTDLAASRQSERVFEPRMGAGERESLYAGWRAAVARVRTDAGDRA